MSTKLETEDPDHVYEGSLPGCYNNGPWIANKLAILGPYDAKGEIPCEGLLQTYFITYPSLILYPMPK